jgi:SAM-dependent methyltransferase
MRAIGVDMDPEPLRRLKGIRNVRPVCADVLACNLKADVISATNFPIGYWHTRRELVKYLKLTRRRLNPGGVFVCDTYGGSTAFVPGSTVRDFWLPDGMRVRYTWQQKEADPISGLVTDVIHFRGFRESELVLDIPDAFTYRWRLWSLPELREAMIEAGFRRIDVYAELADAADSEGRVYVRPVEEPAELGEDWIVCVAARA